MTKVRVVDQNGDGLCDIVAWSGGVINSSDQEAWLSLQDRDGTFAPPQRWPGMDQVNGWTDIDLNGDGRPDRVGVVSTTADVYTQLVPRVLLGNGNGTFDRDPTDDSKFNLQDLGFGVRVSVGDVNRDGIPDLVAPSQVYLGQGDGSFQPGFVLDSLKHSQSQPF